MRLRWTDKEDVGSTSPSRSIRAEFAGLHIRLDERNVLAFICFLCNIVIRFDVDRCRWLTGYIGLPFSNSWKAKNKGKIAIKSTGFVAPLVSNFWVTVCKAVRPILSDRWLSCLSVLSSLSVCLSVYLYVQLYVCNVGGLWPNGWMDQDKTWHAGRPHCVRWRFSSPQKGGGHSPQFSAHPVVAKWLDRLRCYLRRR